MLTNYNSSPFIVKLWKIVGDSSTDELISWNPSGSSFTVHDPERFARELVPQYFKHGSSSSFIRQLNMYGFKKVMKFGKNTDSRDLEFQHAFFLRDKIELLANIKRKIPPSSIKASSTSDSTGNSSSTAQSTSVDAEINFSSNDILTNISILREKQKNMDVVLDKIKKENENLWRELVAVTQRHKSQEQVLQKVIQFLVQIIQRSNQNIHVPRKLARMLQDSSISQENSSLVARIVDVFKNKDSDCIYVPEEANSSPLGAVIHEVTDSELDTLRPTESISKLKFNTSILKTLPKTDKSTLPSINTSATVEPSTVLENLHESRVPSTSNENTQLKSTASSSRYIAFPVAGDPNKLCLIPTENFTSQEISSFKPDAFCNVIALPAKETVSNNNTVTVPSSNSVLNFNLGPVEPVNSSVSISSKPSSLQPSSLQPSSLQPSSFQPSSFQPSSLQHSSFQPSTFQPSSLQPSSLQPSLLQPSSLQPSLLQPSSSQPSLSQVLDQRHASADILTDYSLINSDLSSLVLSDINSPKKISLLKEGPKDYLAVGDTLMDEESASVPESSVSQQLAVPQSSSLVKSNTCYPDFSILQDPVNSPSVYNTRVLEKFFGSDEETGWESFGNPLQKEKDVFINNPPDEFILGNELVQINPTCAGETMEMDPQQLLDALSQEWSDTDLNQFRDTFCSPRDTDVLISSIKSPGLDIMKTETMLTNPPRRPCESEKNKKRRKMK